jgi:hypothetical protein
VGSPLRLLADDYCVVDDGPHGPVVHSLFSAGSVMRADESHFPQLAPARAGADEEKVLFQLAPALEDLLATALPLRCILVPRVGAGADTTASPTSAGHALRAMAPSTLLQLRVGTTAGLTLSRLAALAQRVDAYRLTLGRDRARIAAAIAALLG